MARPTLIVTGGCGYIGAHTILQILRSGTYDVVSIDNLSNSNKSILDRIAGITGTRVKNYTLDLRDRAATLAAFKEVGNVAGVIHFAAHKSVPESTKDPVEYYDNNINSLLNVIGACAEVGVRDLIFSSSCSVFGNVATLPVNEATPLNPVESPYALTKLIGEQLLADATKHMPLRAVALRYFNPVGADTTGLVGEQPTNARPNNLIPFVTRVAAGHLPQLTVYGDDYPTRDGTAVRDYIHVLDIADAHLLAFEHLRSAKAQPYEVFNLGSGEGVSVKEIVEAFIRVTGVPLNWSFGPRRPGDIAAIYSDSSRALSVLGWEPRRGLDEMMDSAWRWQLTLDGKG